jgi:hypothetical protein
MMRGRFTLVMPHVPAVPSTSHALTSATPPFFSFCAGFGNFGSLVAAEPKTFAFRAFFFPLDFEGRAADDASSSLRSSMVAFDFVKNDIVAKSSAREKKGAMAGERKGAMAGERSGRG